MKKTEEFRIKPSMIIILCILGIVALIAYFLRLSILRWIAVALFFLAATIQARFSFPKLGWASILLIVICTAIVAFGPNIIDSGIKTETETAETKTEAETATSPALASSVVTTSSIPSGEPLEKLTMKIYPAEKIDWDTGIIDDLWPIGGNFKVYDVNTGIVWRAHRVSGEGQGHIDVEPLTNEDTIRLCECYGVSSSEEITTELLWQRRPMLVTIGEQTFACSLYGIPHSGPENDVMTNNAFSGRACIHFTNSKTSNANKIDHGHQEAIEYAWENAPNGHK